MEMHHGDHDMQRGQYCIGGGDEDHMMHRHEGSHMRRGMMGQVHGQMHQMMDHHHADCPTNGSDDTD